MSESRYKTGKKDSFYRHDEASDQYSLDFPPQFNENNRSKDAFVRSPHGRTYEDDYVRPQQKYTDAGKLPYAQPYPPRRADYVGEAAPYSRDAYNGRDNPPSYEEGEFFEDNDSRYSRVDHERGYYGEGSSQKKRDPHYNKPGQHNGEDNAASAQLSRYCICYYIL